MNRTLSLGVLLFPALAFAQDRYATRTGEVTGHSETPMENIDAVNHKATSVLDLASGQIQVSMLIKAFEFEKALMQEHFNENYMESNTYPKASFKGTLKGVSPEQLKEPGAYEAQVEGELTIHGVARPVKSKGTVTVAGDGTISASSDLVVRPEDHGIKVPGLVRKKIADEVQVNVRMDYQKMQ